MHFYAQIMILSICFFEEENLFVGKIIDFVQTRGPAQPKIRNKHTNFLTNFHYWGSHNTRNLKKLLVAATGEKINFVTRDTIKYRIFWFLENTLRLYTLRRPVMREVLSTRIWEVPTTLLGK